MRCLHGSLADLEIGISSSPQVKHATCFSGEAGFDWKNEERTEGLFLLGRALALDLARLTSVLAAALVALRLSGGRVVSGATLTVELRCGVAGGSSSDAL